MHQNHATRTQKGMALHVSLGALCCAGADTVSRLRMVRGDGTVLAELQALRCQRVPGLPPCVVFARTRAIGPRVLALTSALDAPLDVFASTWHSDEPVWMGELRPQQVHRARLDGVLRDGHARLVLLVAPARTGPFVHARGELARAVKAVQALVGRGEAAEAAEAADSCAFEAAVQAVGIGAGAVTR
jgi:hypothetical protein